jgi:hypothetical protein
MKKGCKIKLSSKNISKPLDEKLFGGVMGGKKN